MVLGAQPRSRRGAHGRRRQKNMGEGAWKTTGSQRGRERKESEEQRQGQGKRNFT